MARCQSLLSLAVLASLASGQPIDKREVSSHQIVEVPQLSNIHESLQQHPEIHTISSPENADSLRSQLGDKTSTSSDNIHTDHNDVSQSTQLRKKPVMKSDDEMKKRPAGGRRSLKRGKKSNVGLLHHLGMSKIRSPVVNHHRKRLASQSRKTHHQKSTSDSKMFVIKLPPHPYYYAHHDLNGYDVVEPQPKSFNNLPVNFNTNGKPSRVYHWNIPMLKKMVARKAGSSGKSAIIADSNIFNIDKQATWNETDDDKSLYRKAVYYGPKKPSKHTFRKYFAGNGKPHSFYVIEKSKKPAVVHRLLP